MLYNKINGVGYTRLSKETKSWNNLASKRLNKNTTRTRKAVAEWAK
jgi:hypothetical protein